MENHQLNEKNLSYVDKIILSVLAYFDMFNYPLTRSELYLFLGDKCCQAKFNAELHHLISANIIYRFEDFYTLKNNSSIAQFRRKGNQKATELIKTAKKVAALLIKFPYVRGIAISGSLSKNYADENSDIDFFIIAAKNRLWIARTAMHFFKKLSFLIHKEHLFCMNYFIDEAGLEIVEKNIYTATEVVTLIPVEGDIAFKKFYATNSWTLNFLPNNFMRIATAKPLKHGFAKKAAEILLGGRIGNWLETMLQNITASRWLKKTQRKKLNMKGIVMGMSADKHFAKPDPVNFQQKLITRYQKKVAEICAEDGALVNV